MAIRQPAVAGTFYPGDALAARALLDRCLDSAGDVEPVPAKAIIAPHAGWIYSGPIAATAFRAVEHMADRVTRVVLLGPAHRVAFRGLAAPTCDSWATPLGEVGIDRDPIDRLAAAGDVFVNDQPFEGEHALEVQLPFIRRCLPNARVVPLLVGDAGAAAVDRALAALWGGDETLIVVSSDLSHFHPQDVAKRIDLATSQLIEAGRADQLSGERACGHRAISGLLHRALDLDLRITCRDLRDSGDTAGDKARVVGYGAYTFEDAERARLGDADRAQLLDLARRALAHVVGTGRVPAVAVNSFAPAMRAIRKTFVTLTMDGRLRGCVGSLMAHAPLVEDVVGNTAKAATADTRFAPLSGEELPLCDISISILSHARPIRFGDEMELLARLRPRRDGLIIRAGDRSALFLPKVWEVLPDPAQFLAHLKSKAGLDPNTPTQGLNAFHFTTETFSLN